MASRISEASGRSGRRWIGEIEGHPAEKGVAASKSIIVDPPSGRIPYQPSAFAKSQENFKSRKTEDPQTKCFQAGVPRATYLPSPLQIVQSPGRLAIVYEDAHTYRVIYMDGRPHYASGRLVDGRFARTMGGEHARRQRRDLNDQTWFDKAGNFHSEEMHVLERYTLTGPDTLQYEATMSDPRGSRDRGHSGSNLFRHKEPGFRIIEDECLEDRNGVRHHLSPFTGNKTARRFTRIGWRGIHERTAPVISRFPSLPYASVVSEQARGIFSMSGALLCGIELLCSGYGSAGDHSTPGDPATSFSGYFRCTSSGSRSCSAQFYGPQFAARFRIQRAKVRVVGWHKQQPSRGHRGTSPPMAATFCLSFGNRALIRPGHWRQRREPRCRGPSGGSCESRGVPYAPCPYGPWRYQNVATFFGEVDRGLAHH